MSVKDDYLQRIEATLELEGGVSEPVIVQQFAPPRYGYIEIENTAQNIFFGPPPGKVWEILELGAYMACDANVASRLVKLLLYDKDSQTVRSLIVDTLTAGLAIFACIGTAPVGEFTGDGTITYLGNGPIFLWTSVDGVELVKLVLTATNKQAGDLLKLRMFYREHLDFNTRG